MSSPTDFNIRLGATVRAQRVLAGLSQSDLGKELDVTFQQMQKYERGINRLSVESLLVVAKALKTTPQELIDEALNEAVPPAHPVSRMKLNAMRGLSRMPEKLQRIALDVINALAQEAP